MGLKLHNTLTRTKDEFRPIDPTNVRMYVCGPTVYDFAHIGNARPLIVFDVLYRLLRHLYPGPGTAADGSRVTYVRNITDVDDKINARAAEEYPGEPLNSAIRKVTEKTERQFHEDADALGCLRPTYEPRATENIPEMVAMIRGLIEAGHAYVEQSHVLYSVDSKADYGKLSHRSIDDMIAGARVEVAPYKRGEMDFVLWKPSTAGQPGWDSPWGRGRPGWHIECSAMSAKLLGETFDIHGGGIDLIFPHHENEIAQSEGAHHGHPLANVWLHNGFLQVEGEKMSKSAGNFVTIREVLNRVGGWRHPGDIVRLNMLKTHYTEPLDWTERSLTDSADELEGWRRRTRLTLPSVPPTELVDALADDLNTPQAIAVLRRLAKDTSSEVAEVANGARAALVASFDLLGLQGIVADATDGAAEYKAGLRADIAAAIKEVEARERLSEALARGIDAGAVDALVAARAAARNAKNFAEADRIRAELEAMGIVPKDSKDPGAEPSWDIKR